MRSHYKGTGINTANPSGAVHRERDTPEGQSEDEQAVTWQISTAERKCRTMQFDSRLYAAIPDHS